MIARLLEALLGNAALATALALVAFAVSRVAKRPALAHALWLLVLLKLVTPPLYSVAIFPDTLALAEDAEPPLLEPLDAGPMLLDLAAEPATVAPPLEAPADPIPWPLVLVLAWAAGTLGVVALGAVRVLRFRRLVREAAPADASLRGEAAAHARRLGLKRAPDVRTVGARITPLVFAAFHRPVVLFPTPLLERVDGEKRAALLLHELAHVRRRDHWVRAVEAAATALFFWHPVTWWARAELRRAEEECCDAWVVWALPGRAEAYASAILDALDVIHETGRASVPAFASGLGPVDSLKRRLTMIMSGRTPRSLPLAARLALLAGAAMSLPLSAFSAADAAATADGQLASTPVAAASGGDPVAAEGACATGACSVTTAAAPAPIPAIAEGGREAAPADAAASGRRRARSAPAATGGGAVNLRSPYPAPPSPEPVAPPSEPGFGGGRAFSPPQSFPSPNPFEGGAAAGPPAAWPQPDERGNPFGGRPGEGFGPGAGQWRQDFGYGAGPGSGPAFGGAPGVSGGGGGKKGPNDELRGLGYAGPAGPRQRNAAAGARRSVNAAPRAGARQQRFANSTPAPEGVPNAQTGFRRRPAPDGADSDDRIRALEQEMQELSERLEKVRREIQSLRSQPSSPPGRPRSEGAR